MLGISSALALRTVGSTLTTNDERTTRLPATPEPIPSDCVMARTRADQTRERTKGVRVGTPRFPGGWSTPARVLRRARGGGRGLL
ncbi:hypothetical protein CC1G_15094 [Coprinopsis cinerea okayama7|uniref:Uncharacterized protein n=1 Tax=Coprinopsis cinerea (strain Okayama-7 / 130 / ATCC MYA-4618 / FGSC 9003) TaxID=240176 RepID=D6RPG1_COPC7|nr:hypothetical protein CC1G_15094 [Coprinopsis cinerea okayama7\|eukprot:XP_002910760.1 hypothetical protein CC1G_15094 [Coprinopsis cinerea okayama7\